MITVGWDMEERVPLQNYVDEDSRYTFGKPPLSNLLVSLRGVTFTAEGGDGALCK
jgi:hypothetical protein